MKLPVFKGDYEHWLDFKNNFISTIHNNKSLNDNQKLQFLKSALEGYARRIIEGVDIDNTTDQYTLGWNLLCERFDNKKLLVNTHIKAIFNIDQIHKESYPKLRYMLDQISKHTSALAGMKLSKDVLWDNTIIHILASKLDKQTLREWKENQTSDLPTLNQFLEFMKRRADVLESLEECHSKQNTQDRVNPYYSHNNSQMHKSKNNQYSPHPQVNFTITNEIKCNYCQEPHLIYKCQEFLKLGVSDRIDKVKGLRLCFNCLRTGHSKDSCHLGPCKRCKRKHNTLLHNDFLPQVLNTENNSSQNAPLAQSTNLLVRPALCNMQVLLSTVVFNVKDRNGIFKPCRALLDSGAQSNLVTKHFCNQLKLPLTSTSLSIIGINQVVSTLDEKCSIEIFSTDGTFHTSILCYAVPTISNKIPMQQVKIESWNIPEYVKLSDASFYKPGEIDMLIGASLLWDILTEGKIRLGKNLPVLQNTQFGWIVSGITATLSTKKSICNFSKVHSPEDEQLKRFWELEEVSNTIPLSEDDLKCESLFIQDTVRDQKGRFVVKFPLKYSPHMLGNSKDIAIKRFLSLERKMSLNTHFKTQYQEFIKEYEQLGHMSKLDNRECLPELFPCYFLPHHGIMRENNITTKFRTVFDGSCPTSTGWSLNDLQYTGPKVQNDIFDILLRFRQYKFVISSDVTKMYRQILIHPEHRPLQRILWRDSTQDEFSIYQLNTVTYGTKSAPYLSIRCMRQLAFDNSTDYPLASQTILNDFYVDDLLTGSNDFHELKLICSQVSNILESGKFMLRKWNSNCLSILSDIDQTIPHAVQNIGSNESCKTLGIQWLSTSDLIKYHINSSQSEYNSSDLQLITKRKMLSIISQIYDPLGLLSPCIIVAKMIIQQLRSLQLLWDDPVPTKLQQKWIKFQTKLIELNKLSIPRRAIGHEYSLCDIHCFCDASQDAYATAIYLRSQNAQGDYDVNILCSKTKLAPLKSITIPRLELCAALLGAQLLERVMKSISPSVKTYLWSDSQVTLCWIKTEPSLLQVFVANRVSKIQSLSKSKDWHYVNTKENPADLASRGVSAEQLSASILWWKGPEFLNLSIDNWPVTQYNYSDHDLPELKKTSTIFNTTNVIDLDIFSRSSSLNKLKRVVAYCLRFISNSKIVSRKERKYGSLSVVEIDSANLLLVKISQKESFSNELSILHSTGNLDSKHKLSSLVPFVDDKGVIRVGGRLKFTSLDSNFKHPILLSSKHILTKLIFEHKHIYLWHAGPQLLLSSVRQNYWPVGGRNLSKQVVKNCLTCFKFKPTPSNCPMASLPDSRVMPSLPFQVTGVDYTGPFLIKNRTGRGSIKMKCYVCLFVCFCTKSVHLETITDMKTETFFACLKRFTSRRGIPSDIYSDNGSTFVGARNELRELGQFLFRNQNIIMNISSKDNIRWHFSPPYSPNFGGLWEAAVKSTKHHLKRTLLNITLTLEEFNTIIIQIEGILNSRPLFVLSDDPHDLNPITPSHFLIGRIITSLPDPDYQEIKSGRLSRLQHVQQLYQRFWIRFSKEYISQLHKQYKWKESPTSLTIGAVVLIRNNLQPPCKWPLGRIMELIPGKDGHSRVAVLKTSTGTITRSVRFLCVLPFQNQIIN